MKEIILASSSPRRKELLKSIVKDFKIIPSDIEETYPKSLNSLEVSLYISNLKALDIYKKHPHSLVIGCDTTIVFENEALDYIDKNDRSFERDTLVKIAEDGELGICPIEVKIRAI